MVILLGSLAFPVCMVMWLRRSKKGKRSPLTVQLLRAPGESLVQQIDEISDDLDSYLTFTAIIPLLCFSMYLSQRYLGAQQVSWVIYVIITAVFMSWFLWKLMLLYNKRINVRLGLDCERAVGQELNQLMLSGYRVFHDFPADGFNIDHIVVGENGVFAVETKGRAKPVKGDVNIVYDGQGLKFPTHYETDPLNQAKRQADWLAKWLTSAVGAQVGVRPVLVFPGWYIERKKPGLLIYNGKNPQSVYKASGETIFSGEMIQRISHQIEQRCRDVEPLAYKTK